MNRHRALHTILLVAIAALCVAAAAQNPGGPPPQQDMTIDAATRTEVIDGAIKALNDLYVFPDVAQKMEEAVRTRAARGEYNSINSARTLADALQGHLREVSRDKHLRVQYSFEPIPVDDGRGPSPEARERQRIQGRINNYGFEKVERLPGNVGYLDLRGFAGTPDANDTAAAAMNFLANADALIVDMRFNGGGSPAMVAFVSSYLFDQRTHLNDIYWRPNNETREWWTQENVPGKRFGGAKDVYVLTSNRTFSAAEEFTYNLKNLKRAIIVGETTGGGAHPGGPARINAHFQVWVPRGRAINPITKTNWEGTGVTPDVDLAAPLALKTAHVMALKKIEAANKLEWRAAPLREALAEAERQLAELKK